MVALKILLLLSALVSIAAQTRGVVNDKNVGIDIAARPRRLMKDTQKAVILNLSNPPPASMNQKNNNKNNGGSGGGSGGGGAGGGAGAGGGGGAGGGARGGGGAGGGGGGAKNNPKPYYSITTPSVTEETACVPFDDSEVQNKASNSLTSTECIDNSCSGGCCRLYLWLICDEVGKMFLLKFGMHSYYHTFSPTVNLLVVFL